MKLHKRAAAVELFCMTRYEQGKYWLCTLHDKDDKHHLDINPPPYWTSKNIVWSKGQLEKGLNTGAVHWQFMVCFQKKVRRTTVVTAIGFGVHAELSTSPAANEYVWKEETSLGHRWEFGEKPKQVNKKCDWEDIWKHAKEGDVEALPANIRVLHYNSIRRIAMDHMKPTAQEKEVKVIWGATGLGKSRLAWAEAGLDAYPKAPTTKFWDGYQQQENVVMDEFFGQIEVNNSIK